MFSEAVWDEDPPPAQMADVLRVHAWSYISSIQEICDALEDDPSVVCFPLQFSFSTSPETSCTIETNGSCLQGELQVLYCLNPFS